MSMIVWILLGLVLGLIASKIVSTTGEGTVVDILLGIVGAIVGGWLFDLFGGSGLTGFNSRGFTAPAARQSSGRSRPFRIGDRCSREKPVKILAASGYK